MRFKAGDYVMVKPRDEIEYDDCIGWDSEMDQYCGKCFIVRSVYNNYYNLESAGSGNINGNGYWMFVDKWLDYADRVEFDLSEDELIGVLNV